MDLYDDTNPIKTLDINSILTNTFFRMFLGLFASAITAFYTYYSGLYINIVMSNSYAILAVVEVAVVFVFCVCIFKWFYLISNICRI